MKSSLSLLLFISVTTAYGQTSATWTGAAGNWSDGTKWTTTPIAPINGQPGAGDTYDATLANGQIITLDTAVVIESLTLTSGNLSGTGTLTVNGLTSFTSGGMYGAGSVNANGGVAFTGSTPKSIYNSRVLNLGGNSTWDAGGLQSGGDGQINTTATGTLDTDFDGTISNDFGGTASFNNAGVFTKSGGTGTTLVNITFNNSGTVNANSGTIRLNAGGTHLNGSFNAATGGTLEFKSGTSSIGGTSEVTGTGVVWFSGGSTSFNEGNYDVGGTTRITGGTVNFNSGAKTHFLDLSGGYLTGTDTLTVNGLTSFTSGGMYGAGSVNANGGVAFTGSTPKSIYNSRVLNLGGNSTWDAGGLQSGGDGQINTTATGTLDTDFDGTINNDFGGTASFNNAGVFTKSGGTGTTLVNITFNNSGIVNANSGTIRLNAGVIQHSATTLTGGTWNVTTGAAINISTGINITTNQGNVTLDGSGSSFVKLTTALDTNEGGFTLKNDRDLTTVSNLANSGVIRVEDATTLLTVTGSYTQSGGSTTMVGGAQFTASSFNLGGGTLAGTGTINGNLVSTGSPLVAPGLSAGSLTVNGNATLSGTLAMEIGGLVPGAEHDEFLVSGNLAVGGSLSLALFNGFIPAYGQNLTLASAGDAISSSFANVASGGRVMCADGIHSFAVNYGASSSFGSDKIVLGAFSDNIAPVLTLPANITKEATGPVSTPVAFVVSANDAIQGTVPAFATPASGSGFVLGTTIVNVTASDVGGNTANKSFTVTIVDTTAPELTVPASPVLATTYSTAGAIVNFNVSATDVADVAPTVVATPSSGSNFPLGDTQVNVTATDATGNQSTGNFIVSVTGLPKLGIVETGGAEISDGGSMDFGPVSVGMSSSAKSLTVSNGGAVALTLGAITVGGSDPMDFTATSPTSTSLASGESATFSVTFTPSATGLRSSELQLLSDDSNVPESVFDISLTGTGFDMKLTAVTLVSADSSNPASISGSIIGGPPNSTVQV